jgi:hypothetical protein
MGSRRCHNTVQRGHRDSCMSCWGRGDRVSQPRYRRTDQVGTRGLLQGPHCLLNPCATPCCGKHDLYPPDSRVLLQSLCTHREVPISPLYAMNISRFNLSTAGWQLGPSSSRPVQFMFLANYHRGNPVPLSDLGPWSLLPGLLLPLSLTDAAGMVEITVMARDSGGCDTFVSPSVSVTVQSPSLSNLADHYAGIDYGLASTDDHCSPPSNTTSCASLRSSARRLRCYATRLLHSNASYCASLQVHSLTLF